MKYGIMNKKRGLLAVVMALAMVFAGAVFVADEADATSDVAMIGDVPYTSLSAAVDAATAGTEDVPVEIKLIANVEWDSTCGAIENQYITIMSDGENRYRIDLKDAMTLKGTTALTFKDCVINSVEINDGYDNQILVNGDSAKLTTDNCKFTYDSVIVDPHAVNITKGDAEFKDTDFSGSKVTYVTDADLVIFDGCQNVYINQGKDMKFLPVSTTPYVGPGIVIDDSEVDFLKVHQGKNVDLNGVDIKVGTIFVKDDSQTTGTIYGNQADHGDAGSLAGFFALYEPGIDGNDAGKVNINGVNFAGVSSIASNVSVQMTNATIAVDATLNVAGAVTGTLTNDGTIVITSDNASIGTATIFGAGSVDASAVQKDAYFGGDIVTKDTTFSENQIVNITADTTISDDAKLIIKGTIIIPEGITLTLEDTSMLIIMGSTAKLYNYGAIVVESEGQEDTTVHVNLDGSKTALSIVGGYGENDGTIALVYDDEDFDGRYGINYSMYVDRGTFENNGTIEIAEYNTLGIDRTSPGTTTVLNNNAGAEIAVEGALIGFVDNGGTVTVNGFAYETIHLTSVDAVVDIVSLSTYDVPLVVDNSGLKYGKDKQIGTGTDAADAVTLTTNVNGTDTYTLEGLIIKTTVSSYKNSSGETVYSHAIDISGDVSASTSKEDAGEDDEFATVTLENSITVSGDLAIADEVMVAKGTTATLAVSGNMTLEIDDAMDFTVTVVKVTGKLVSDVELNDDGFSAAYYKVKADSINKIPEQHIYTTLADAIAAAPKKIDVLGALTVKTEITIPADIQVTLGSTLTVTEKGDLTVADGSKLTLGDKATVEGVMLVENKKNLYAGGFDVVSDVVTTDGDSILYSGLAYALSVATEGQTVKISDKAQDVTIAVNTTIPAGVTLDTNNKGVTVNRGCTLTVDGTLFLNNGNLTLQDKNELLDDAEIVLNGTIKGQSLAALQDDVAGAYYQMFEKSVIYDFVEPVAAAAPKALDVIEQTITVIGVKALGDVAFTGTEDKPVTVQLTTEVESGKVTVEYASAVFSKNTSYTMAVAEKDGSVALSKVTSADGFTIACGDVDDVETFSVTGKLTAGSKGSISLDGTVAIIGATFDTVTVAGDVTSTGTTTVGTLKVIGTLTVPAGETVAVTGNAYVNGALVGAEKTETKVGGIVNVGGTVYVGFTSSVKVLTTAGTGSVSGDIKTKQMYVEASATVPADLVEDMDKVEFYIGETLFMIGYTSTGDLTNIPKVDSKEFNFVGWKDENKGSVVSGTKVADIKGDVKADIVYEVYKVTFVAAEGIDDVYLDGVLVGNLANGVLVAAGTHTVSYTLANGYTGEAKMLVNGTEVSGYTFTASGDYTKMVNGVNYTITLQGIEKAPAEVGGGDAPTVVEKDEGMSLTDILLIILVVLIVIMAIIVALRMMRS